MAGTATITITQSDQIPELGLKPSQNEIDAFRSSGVGVVRSHSYSVAYFAQTRIELRYMT